MFSTKQAMIFPFDLAKPNICPCKLMLPLNTILYLFSNSDIASPKIKDICIFAPLFAQDKLKFLSPSLLPHLWFSANIKPSTDLYHILKLKTPHSQSLAPDHYVPTPSVSVTFSSRCRTLSSCEMYHFLCLSSSSM